MDDYTPTDQVSATNGVGLEPRHPFIWILYVIYFSLNGSWNRAYHITSKYTVMVIKEGEFLVVQACLLLLLYVGQWFL